MRRLLGCCRRHLVAAAVFSALLNLLYIAPTIYMLQVYDRVVPTRGLQTLAFLTLVLLFAISTLALLDRVRVRLLARAGAALDAELAPKLLDATLGRPETSEARQALRDADQLRLTLTGPGALAVFDAPWLPIYILVCFMVHPWIGATALSGAIILPLIAWANERATRFRLDTAQEVAARTYGAQDTVLNGAEAVRALGMRRAMVALQLRHRESMLVAQTEAALAGGGYVTATKFVRLMLQSLALGLGAWLAVDNKISAGAIFASSFLIARALAPIEQLVGTWRSLVQFRGIVGRLDHLLDGVSGLASKMALPAPRGELSLTDVTVLTPKRDGAILDRVTFAVGAGDVVAIVGASGAGKSTLVRLIAGATQSDGGIIRMDGADLRDWEPEQLAPHIGYLPQEPSLFAGTIADNISRFSREIDGARDIGSGVVAAAEAVGAKELIQRLPGGFDYQLGTGGRGLSAGQAQRVALARAMYGNPTLLILDEPNAHLDAEGDAALAAVLGRAKAQGRTVLIVSHKMSVLPAVDRILVLSRGRIADFGTRDEVMARLALQARAPAARQGAVVKSAHA